MQTDRLGAEQLAETVVGLAGGDRRLGPELDHERVRADGRVALYAQRPPGRLGTGLAILERPRRCPRCKLADASAASASRSSGTRRADRRENAFDLLGGQVGAEAERVCAGRQRAHGRALDSLGPAGALHLECVGHHDAVEAELGAQQLDHGRVPGRRRLAEARRSGCARSSPRAPRPRSRRRTAAGRARAGRRGPPRKTAAPDASRRPSRRGRGSAWRRPRRRRSADPRRRPRRGARRAAGRSRTSARRRSRSPGRRARRPPARGRGRSRPPPARRRSPRRRAASGPGRRPRRARGSRERAPARGLEPRHVAALLVRRDDQQLRPLGPQRRRQRRHLLGVARCCARRGRRRRGRRPSQRLSQSGRSGRGSPGRGRPPRPGSLAHPRTAPAVSPNAIFRCTIRKKTITGIAISVEPAIRPPQSVLRLVPEK